MSVALPSHAHPEREAAYPEQDRQALADDEGETQTSDTRAGSLDWEIPFVATSASDPFRIPENINGADGIRQPAPGFAHPVDGMRLIRGFDDDHCWHQGIDVGGFGPMGGVGEAVYSMVKAKVIFVGTPEDSPSRFGRRDRRPGTAKRRNLHIPRRLEVEGYPTVYPFTRSLGTAKTGVFLVTKAIHPRIQGHYVRYMHLASVRPNLKRGDVLEAGEEIGLLGATAVMESYPHVHIDIETASGRRVDPAPFIGVSKILSGHCRPIVKRAWAKKGRRPWRRTRRHTRRH